MSAREGVQWWCAGGVVICSTMREMVQEDIRKQLVSCTRIAKPEGGFKTIAQYEEWCDRAVLDVNPVHLAHVRAQAPHIEQLRVLFGF